MYLHSKKLLWQDTFYKKIHYLTFDRSLKKVAQYTLHHVKYAPPKFEVAISNALEEDTIIRKVMDTWMDDGRTLVQN